MICPHPPSEILKIRPCFKIICKQLSNCFNTIWKVIDKCNGNSKKTWELINELRGKSVSKTNHSNFVVQGKLVKERRIIADEFNKYFTLLAHNLNENASKQWMTLIYIC